MVQPIIGIKEFPDDDKFWRVVLLAGISKNSRVQSEPFIEVLLTSLPDGDPLQLGATGKSSLPTRQVKVGVGQLPYISTGSIWHRQKPVSLQLPAYSHLKREIDTSRVRFISIGELVEKHHVIPMSRYAFGKHWPIAAHTQVAAVEINGDPWAILIPVIELIRFYYAPSTRLTQALFWGEYAKSINEKKCGQIMDGPYRVHLRKWIADSDAWTLARFHASKDMQRQVRGLYQGIQGYFANAFSAYPDPFRSFQCGFPFVGKSQIEALYVPLPGPEAGVGRSLVLKLLSCSAPFPFEQLLCDRDNRNLKGKNSGEDDLEPAWRRKIEEEDEELDEWGNPPEEKLHSEEEPYKGSVPLKIDIREDRFTDLRGKKLLKEETERQKYRSATSIVGRIRLRGFGTGSGIWGNTESKRAEINTARPGNVDKPTLAPTLKTFFLAIGKLALDSKFKVRYVSVLDEYLEFSKQPASIGFPTYDPVKRKPIKWATTVVGEILRSRRVAVTEVSTAVGVCYVLEAERLDNDETMSLLVIATMNYMSIDRTRLYSILLKTACKGRWLPTGEMPDYHRATTTHQLITSTEALASRIKNKVCEVMGMPIPKKKAGVPSVTAVQKRAAPTMEVV